MIRSSFYLVLAICCEFIVFFCFKMSSLAAKASVKQVRVGAVYIWMLGSSVHNYYSHFKKCVLTRDLNPHNL